jgi:hypothetical protein
MIMKIKIIPFDLETAKKIQAGEIEGKIKTTHCCKVRIICWDRIATETPIVILVQHYNWESLHECNLKGEYMEGSGDYARLTNLVLEVPDNEPQFKPFDKVLVRHYNVSLWQPAFFWKFFDELSKTPYYTIDGNKWEQCIQYEGNEHLVGTTDKPKGK